MATNKGSLYVYKFENPKADSSTKRVIFKGWAAAGLRRFKTFRETEGGGRPEGDEVEKVIVEVARKSVSSIEPRKSVSSIEPRKSVSSIEPRKSVSSMDPRKSVRNVEVNVRSTAELFQVKVMASDMPGLMQVHAFRCARVTYDSLEKFSSKHLAYNIKKEFDKVYGPAWHCIVGSSFGSFVTHSTGGFLYFSMEKLYILVFKTKIQKALQT